MPKSHTLIDQSEAPSKPSTSQAWAAQQRVYDEIVAPLVGNPDKAIRVEVDKTPDANGKPKESQKGVSLALVYAAERAGFVGKSWYHGDDAVYIAHATEAEAKLREQQRANRKAEKEKAESQNSNGNGSKPDNAPATGDQTPRPQAQKPEQPAAKK